MKKFRFLYIAATALLFAACANEDESIGNNGLVAATVQADILNNTNTRATVNNTWTANEDAIGVSVTSTGYTVGNNVKYVASDQIGNFKPADEPIYFADTEEATFSAYYPYSSNATQNETLAWQGGVVKDGKCQWDFLFANGATAKKSSPTVSFSGNNPFKHRMAMVRFVINAGKGVNGSEAALHGDFVLDGVVNDGFVNTRTGEVSVGATATKTKLTESLNQSLKDGVTVSFIVLPQDVQNNSMNINLVAAANGTVNTYSTYLTAPEDYKFSGGNMYTYYISVTNTEIKLESSTITEWAERELGELDANMEP